MNLVLLEAGCVPTTGNRTTALYYVPYFLCKSGRERGNCLVADAGVGGSGWSKETQAGWRAEDGHGTVMGEHAGEFLEGNPVACWRLCSPNLQRRRFYNGTLLITNSIKSSFVGLSQSFH